MSLIVWSVFGGWMIDMVSGEFDVLELFELKCLVVEWLIWYQGNGKYLSFLSSNVWRLNDWHGIKGMGSTWAIWVQMFGGWMIDMYQGNWKYLNYLSSIQWCLVVGWLYDVVICEYWKSWRSGWVYSYIGCLCNKTSQA